MSGLDIAIPSGIAGALCTVIGNIIISTYKNWSNSRNGKSSIENKLSIDEKRNILDQVKLLLESSEKYRDEVRSDMERLKLELEKQAKQCNDELSSMKSMYENELHSMQKKMTALTEEVAEYRRENGALHLLLRDRGVEIPSWVKK